MKKTQGKATPVEKNKNREVYVRLVFFCFLPIILIPTAFFPNTLDKNLQIRTVLLAVYTLALIGYFTANYKKAYPAILAALKLLYFKLFIAYSLFSVLSLWLYQTNVADGVSQWLNIPMLGILSFLLIVAFYDIADFRNHFTKAFILLGILISIVGLYDLISISSKQTVTHTIIYQMTSTLASKNIFAEFLVLVFPFCIYGFWYFRKSWRSISIIMGFLSVFMLFLTLTRAAWVAYVISSFMVFLLTVFIYKKSVFAKLASRKMLIFSTVCLLALSSAMVLYVRLDGIERIKIQAQTVVQPSESSGNDRIVKWKRSLEMIQENPVLGIGMGAWRVAFMKYGKAGMIKDDFKTFYQRPHNDYLWIAAEQGLIAFSIYMLMCLLLLGLLLRNILKANTSQIRFFFIAVLFSFIAYHIFAVFSFPKERIEHILIQAFFAAMISIPYLKISKVKVFKPRTAVIAVVSLLTIAIITLFIGAVRLNAEVQTKHAFDARNKSNWHKVIAGINKAENRFFTMDGTATPLSWYKGLAYYNMNQIPQATESFQRAYDINPYHIHVLNNLGTCYEKTGNRKKAIELFDEALRISPKFPDALMNKCAIVFNEGNIEEAYALISRIDDYEDPRYQTFISVILNAIADNIDKQINCDKTRERFRIIRKNKNLLIDIHEETKGKIGAFEKKLFDKINLPDSEISL